MMSIETTLTTPVTIAATTPEAKALEKRVDLGRWMALGTVAAAGLATCGFWVAVYYWFRHLLA